jgi:hypothetical protein
MKGIMNSENESRHLSGEQDLPIVLVHGTMGQSAILLQLAERKYGRSQLDWLFQKDQVARSEFKSLRAIVNELASC